MLKLLTLEFMAYKKTYVMAKIQTQPISPTHIDAHESMC